MRAERARRLATVIAVSAAVAATMTQSGATADDSRGARNTVAERLAGYQEDPLALSTTGTGVFRAEINEEAQQISWRLSYSALEGTVTQAHIHFGGRAQSGGISVFLCTNQGNGPVGTQACPPAPATVTGTITPTDIIGPAGQGITAGQFAEFVAAIRAGTTYANVHSSMYPAGEIRGQLGR